jgi:hypothetical protein
MKQTQKKKKKKKRNERKEIKETKKKKRKKQKKEREERKKRKTVYDEAISVGAGLSIADRVHFGMGRDRKDLAHHDARMVAVLHT